MKKATIQQMILGMVSTNCYFCMNTETKELFIVDPADQADRIFRAVNQMGGQPVAILLTHGHFDHISAADEVRRKYNIPVYIHELEEKLLADPVMNLSGSWATAVSLTADHLLKEGEKITVAGFAITVIHTPGHTPGGCCYYLPEEKVLFSGDTLFCQSVGRTDFPGSSTAAMFRSLHKLLETLPEDTNVLPGHGEMTRIDFEKRNNPYA